MCSAQRPNSMRAPADSEEDLKKEFAELELVQPNNQENRQN